MPTGRALDRAALGSTVLAVVVLIGGLVWILTEPGRATTTTPPKHHSTTTSTSRPSRTTPYPMAVPAGYTPSQLLFEDDFAGTTLDTAKWNTYYTSNSAHGAPWNSDGHGGSGAQNPALVANAEYDFPSQVTVGNGLTLTAVRAPTPGFLGTKPHQYDWRSGVVSTYGHFDTDGGYIQIEAKMPPGDGMWPSLWMLPGPEGTQGDNFEIDIVEGGFVGGGVSTSHNVAWHLNSPAGLEGDVTNVNTDITSGYHVYAIKWVPGRSITWYFDGQIIGQVTSAQSPIPDEPMELIMDLGVANNATAPYRTAVGPGTPSPAQMVVHQVQVYR